MHQEREYPGRVVGTTLVNPDFAAYARSFGADGYTVEATADFAPAFAQALRAGKPAVIELKIDPEAIAAQDAQPDPRRELEFSTRHPGTPYPSSRPRGAQSGISRQQLHMRRRDPGTALRAAGMAGRAAGRTGWDGLKSSDCTRRPRGTWPGGRRCRRRWRACWLPRSGSPPRSPARACWRRRAPGPRCRPPA